MTGHHRTLAFRIEPSGSLAASGITLKSLMMTAYNVQGFRIVGGPDWMASRRWDVQAKPDRVASPDQIRPMLRALLEDRFQLRSHSEKRERPVYELSVDRKGSKLQRVKDETKADVRVGAGLIQLTKAMAATFASQLSYALGRPVIDQTNLSGDRTVSEARSSGFTRPNFGRCSEQLGLRLKSGRGPVEVIMIDEAQMPTVN